MSNVKVRVENSVDGSEIDVKRFSLPAKIHWTCSECGTEHVKDLTSDYLSFPPCNTPFKHTLYCGNETADETADADGNYDYCDHEDEVELVLEIRLRLAGDGT